MFDERFIDELQNAVKGEEVEIRGKKYSTRPVYLPPEEKRVSILTVHSLTGLIDYLNNNVDGETGQSLFIHIEDARNVSVYAEVQKAEGHRMCWLEAQVNLQDFSFSRYLATDDFIAAFQSLFERDEKTDFQNVLSYISNIVKEESIETSDDSVSQQIVTQRGVNRKNETVKNPVTLRPIRTFTEVEQPASPFVLRLRNEGQVTAALYPADNGKWENEARANIKKFLEEKLANKIPILA